MVSIKRNNMRNRQDFKPFLKQVAEKLYDANENSRDFSRLTVVFPNRRARLFLNKYLLEVCNRHEQTPRPIIAPRYCTSNEIFGHIARLQGNNLRVVNDVEKVRLVLLLYTAYQQTARQKTEETGQDGEVPRRILEKTKDEFYFLGEVLLSDFDEIDKHLVDANKLYGNITDYNQLLDDKYINEEQIKIIRELLDPAFSKKDELQAEFVSLWEMLGQIYSTYREILKSKGIAYAGMQTRMVIEALGKDDSALKEFLGEGKIAFVGFNAMNGCEKKLLKQFDKTGLAHFYWDYDDLFYDPKGVKDKARLGFKDDPGTFLREHLQDRDPNRMKPNAAYTAGTLPDEMKNENHDYLSSLCGSLTTLTASSDTIQAKYAGEFLRDIRQKDPEAKDNEIAIVLADEGLLPAVLHSIPSDEPYVNITMGYPLSQTPAYDLLQNLIALQANRRGNAFNYRNVLMVMRQPDIRRRTGRMADTLINKINLGTKYNITWDYIQQVLSGCELAQGDSVFDFFRLLFETPDNTAAKPCTQLVQWLADVLQGTAATYRGNSSKVEFDEDLQNFAGLYEEALYRLFQMVNVIISLQKEDEENLSCELFLKLSRNIFATAKVPFTGEPSRGIQVMGFLETRSLDFKYVLMLSAQEGNMPKSGKNHTFIPYIMRTAYGLPTIEHEDALYAYNFYRQLMRPLDIRIAYNNTQVSKANEPTRFLKQIEAEFKRRGWGNVIKERPLYAPNITTTHDPAKRVEKTQEIVDNIIGRYSLETKKEAQKKGEKIPSPLSPTAINAYLDCSMRFYFSHVLQLSNKEDFNEDIDEAMFGRVFHTTMQNIYQRIAGESDDTTGDWQTVITTSGMAPYVTADTALQIPVFHMEAIEAEVDKALAQELHINLAGSSNPMDEYNGQQIIKRDVIINYTRNQLELDYITAREHNLVMMCPEYRVEQPIEITLDSGRKIIMRVGGIIDRRDKVDDVYRIVDYKTGKQGKHAKATDTGGAFTSKLFEGSNRKEKMMQTLLYSCLINMTAEKAAEQDSETDLTGEVADLNPQRLPLQPVLMFPLAMSEPSRYDARLTYGSRSNIKTVVLNTKDSETEVDPEDEFMALLRLKIKEMLNPEIPFEQTADTKRCTFCDFKTICHREQKQSL